MCFITPKRVRRGNASTISVVVLGPLRRRSRIARRVASESAFQTSSRSLGIPLHCPSSLRQILPYVLQDVAPSGAHTLFVRGIEQPDRPMTKRELRAPGNLVEFYFHVIDRRIRHEQRAAQFQQNRGLDYLHMPP